MNYKSIIRSRKLRIKILSLLAWVPDRIMIPLQYRIHTGRRCNLNKPTRLSEKLQLYKLTYRDPLMLRCTDKYEVRNVIQEFGYEDILIPLVGAYDNITDIDIKNLPSKFVIKTTDGGGGNQVLICKDKSKLNINHFYSKLKEWMNAPKGKNVGREWAYRNSYPRRILVEQLLMESSPSSMADLELYGWNEKIYFIHQEKEGVWVNTIKESDLPIKLINLGLTEAQISRLLSYVASACTSPFLTKISLYYKGGTEWCFCHYDSDVEPPYSHQDQISLLQSLPEEIYKEKYVKTIMIDVEDKSIFEPGLVDYKFFCFNGKVKFIYGISGRKVGVGAEVGIYTPDWVKLNVNRTDEFPAIHTLKKPDNFDRMLQIAEDISSHFPHVRVDLYSLNSKIYFGELTFYDGSGYMEFDPDSFDMQAGEMFEMKYLNK